MGKPTGFLEYERKTGKAQEPLKIEGFRFFLKSFVVFVIRKKQKRQ